MNNQMPQLPYAKDALAPVLSSETIDYHYGKHLQAYVNNLSTLVPGTEFEGKDIEYIVANAMDGAIYNNAGQVLNHTMYFMQFNPTPVNTQPVGKVKEAIETAFGSFSNFKREFTNAAVSLFGSGWAWLSCDRDGKLIITKEANGGNPLHQGLKPLLCFDVWEHAYYIDYRNRRADYINELWKIIDWDVIEQRFG